jgi:tRNA A37 threonylcarbamoyladenosine modification protein TsaB
MSLTGVAGQVDMIGSGGEFLDEMPGHERARISSVHPGLLPEARDLVPLALAGLESEDWQPPLQVQPVYVRDEISWKKLSEQGPAR